MNDWQNPTTDYPGLTLYRLQAVADAMRTARMEAVADHRPEEGESEWTLGCSGYERTKHAVMAMASNSWLTVLDGERPGPSHFVFAIGGHPVRFCRGDAEAIPQRYRVPSLFDVAEFEMGLPSSVSLVGNGLRLVIETDDAGLPTDIVLIEIDSMGNTLRGFIIPGAGAAHVSTVTPFLPPAPTVYLPAVQAEPLEAPPVHGTGTDE